VGVGDPLARLVQIAKVKIEVGLPERDVSLFSVGDPVQIKLDAVPSEQLNGTIYRIATTGEMATRTFVTEIEVDNEAGTLKPGMIARVQLVRHTFPEAIVAPIFSVITTENEQYVFVDEDGIARKRPVAIGTIKGATVHILRGLAAGDRLVVKGQRDLHDGDPVRTEEPPA